MESELKPLKARVENIARLQREALEATWRAQESREGLEELVYRTFENGASARQIAEVLGVSSVATIYRRVEKYKQKAGLKSDTKDKSESEGGF